MIRVTTTDVPADNTSTAAIRGDNNNKSTYTIKVGKSQRDLYNSRDTFRSYSSYLRSRSSGKKKLPRHPEAEEVLFWR